MADANGNPSNLAEMVVGLITDAARFTPTSNEDYTIVDHVGDLYVDRRRLLRLLEVHPELKPEVESWSVESLVEKPGGSDT